MTDLEYFKEADLLFDKYIEEKHGCNEYWLDHSHICDFMITQRLRGMSWKWAKFQCKKYLRKYGLKQDEYFSKCDECPHMKTITYSDNGFILSILPTGVSDDRNFYNKQMLADLDYKEKK